MWKFEFKNIFSANNYFKLKIIKEIIILKDMFKKKNLLKFNLKDFNLFVWKIYFKLSLWLIICDYILHVCFKQII